uniref:LIM domain 7a n=1 Tax=Oryzias melastigma TaxID=30732 RepID=A0A3B3C3S5_ORYME
MEWREQSTVSSEEAFQEAQRWIEAVTKKNFGSSDFRSALESGVLLCDLINKIKPGLIKRVNRLPTPIAGLDNLNVFLKACGKLGLKEAQLFHPGDLQDLSTRATVKHQETDRRLKNVLITIYWLGRRAQSDRLYDGPYLNFKAFEGLLGTALYKALQDSSSQKRSSVRDSGFGENWYSEREELHRLRGRGGGEGGGGGRRRRDDSLDSLDSVGSRPHSISSDTTLKGSSEGCSSDAETDSIVRMAENKDTVGYRRSASITPKVTAQYNQFLPTKDKQSGYVPAPLRKKRTDRNEDNRRSLVNYSSGEDESRLTRSKSTSDIDADAMALRQLRYEELQKFREQIKESDDKWQDDLTKWKNRRRSVNSDIVKKKEEREKTEQITYGEGRRSKTFKEMQEERESKTKNRISSRLASLSFLHDSDDAFEAPVIAPSRTHLPRSYTIDAPYSSYQPPESPKKLEDSPASSPPPFRAASPPTRQKASGSSNSSDASSPTAAPSSDAPKAPRLQRSRALEDADTTSTNSASFQKAPEPKHPLFGAQAEVEAPPLPLHKEEPKPNSMEPKPPELSRVSSSLPKSYQRSDSSRLTSVVTPRPFGTQSSRISSLPRVQTMDNSHQRVNGNASIPQKTSVPSRYQPFVTSEDEAQSSSAQSSEEEEKDEVKKEDVRPTESSISTVSPASPGMKSQTKQEDFCEMRVNLNQKPNSSRDFGFQANWDSTGARVSSIQPGSSAEMCQLQVGDEVLSVNGHKVADMSYTEWKSCMDQALQDGSLVMDVRRHGQNSSPDTKTVSSSLDLTSHISPEPVPSKEAPGQTAAGVASNGVNGGLHEEPVTMRNKESEPISLKNLKRRSEFFEQGGSNASMPDIPVPAITPPSNRWTWDPEEERRRQEKWQMEQERLLQEKYMRDQQKLQEEWHKAQQEISTSVGQQEHLEVNSHHAGAHSPLSSSVHQTAPPAWAEEERKRREEQERQRQEEERRKREEEERELRHLQEERKRREEQERQRQEEERRKREEEERRKREEEERELRRLQEERKRREEQEVHRRRREAEEQELRERERALEQQRQQQWAGHSHGFASVQQPLSFTDRAKSKSSPQLDEDEDGQRGSSAGRKGQQPQSQSQAELERQQILNKMKKKASLQRDGSWIRQSSTTTPTNKGESDPPFMRRGESLDNLDHDSHRSSWSPRSNSFVQNYSQPPHGLYGSSSGYGGGFRAQRPVSVTLPYSQSMGSLRGGAGTHSFPWSRQSSSTSTLSPTTPDPLPEGDGRQQRSRSVSGKKMCSFCDTPLGRGAAMIIESLGLCYHLDCFKCAGCMSSLGGSEAGAEVRIRNQQLYCNSCYLQAKSESRRSSWENRSSLFLFSHRLLSHSRAANIHVR